MKALAQRFFAVPRVMEDWLMKKDRRLATYAPLHAVCDARPGTDLSGPGARLTAKLLLDCGAMVNALDRDRGVTPPHLAVFAQLPDVIELLLNHRADVNLRDPGLQKTKILANAMRTRDLRIVKMIIDAGADVLDLDEGLDARRLAGMLFFGDQLRQVEVLIGNAFSADDEQTISTGGMAHEA